MAIVFVPALLRPLAGGAEQVRASGATLSDVIEDLDRQHPGIRDRLLDGREIRSEIALAVDGSEATDLGTPVGEDAEVHILPAIAGG
jgi:molybdopterin converting factor small subunit